VPGLASMREVFSEEQAASSYRGEEVAACHNGEVMRQRPVTDEYYWVAAA
jgi:hypothetical protein